MMAFDHPLLGLLTLFTLWSMATLAVSCMAATGWGLWPVRAAAVKTVLAQSAGRNLLLGLANILAYVVAIKLMQRAGHGELIARLLFLWVVGLTLSGLPGAVALFGERVLAHARHAAVDGGPSMLRSVFVGTWVVAYAGMIPLVGWGLLFLFLAATFGAGLGAFMGSLGRRSGP